MPPSEHNLRQRSIPVSTALRGTICLDVGQSKATQVFWGARFSIRCSSGESLTRDRARMIGRSQNLIVFTLIALNLCGAASVLAAEKPKAANTQEANGWSATIVTDKKKFSQTGVASFYSADG